jgi:uncharacterized protein YbjQ (UPF0145 family)
MAGFVVLGRSAAHPAGMRQRAGSESHAAHMTATRAAPMLVVTIDSLPGYDIVDVVGNVLGTTARPHNPFIEGARSLPGSPTRGQPQTLTGWRTEAIDRMLAMARRHGANAVIGMRFDHRTLSNSWTEICAYGTAVVVAPTDRDNRATSTDVTPCG